jgi:hypothetical protein
MIKKIPLLLCFLCATRFLSFGQTTICDTIINVSDEDALVCDFFPTTNLSTSEDYMFSSWTSGGVPYIFRALHKLTHSSKAKPSQVLCSSMALPIILISILS